jgi:hypothetical protein
MEPSADQVVWAPRGGGKTRLAAIATMLDLLHKPNTSVRILGGSLEQSLRTWEHLLPDIERLAPDLLVPKRSRTRRIDTTTGASAAVLTQSEKSVRGLRVQKLRCDEVELFDREVFEAAQLVTRSQGKVRGSIDFISTLHQPFGLMSEVVDTAMEKRLKIVRWCLLEVLEQCPAERDCTTCPLWDDCGGVAKTKCSGFQKPRGTAKSSAADPCRRGRYSKDSTRKSTCARMSRWRRRASRSGWTLDTTTPSHVSGCGRMA